MDGAVAPDHDEFGRPTLDDDVLVFVNAGPEPVAFTVPDVGPPHVWRPGIDTSAPDGVPGSTATVVDGASWTVGARSIAVLWSSPRR